MRTIQQTIAGFPERVVSPQLPKPSYSPTGETGGRIGLAVESMKRHMTDEGWQLFAGLQETGYFLTGKDLGLGVTDCRQISEMRDDSPTLVIQDKREWEGLTADRSQDPSMRFTHLESLKAREDIFKLTILKDAQHNQAYHRQSADEIGCHAWVIYYHPLIVSALAPYVRPEHLVRTYHSVDADMVPPFNAYLRMSRAVVSGATSGAYPLRTSITQACIYGTMKHVEHIRHPGYHRNGSNTPEYLKTLSRYRVAICTSSRYGYALRKIVEATAAGCIVITDLPKDEVLPEIDRNRIRIPTHSSPASIDTLVRDLLDAYNPALQEMFASRAKDYYDYRYLGRKLAADIETLRRNY